MEQNKIDMFVSTSGKKFPGDKIGIIQSQLEKVDDKKFLSIQSANYKSPATLILVSIFLGGFGIDRFMLGHSGMGIGKLLTCGGFGLWWLIDIFLISGETKENNFYTFSQVAN